MLPPDASTPPEPLPRVRLHRESILPPRAMGAAGSSASLVFGAAGAAYAISDPTIRALVMLACGVVAWVIGYLTPPPRRNFRRTDK